MRCEERRSKTPPATPTIAASARKTSSGRVFIEALWPRRERDGSLEKQKVNFVEFILREPIGRGDERQFPYLVRMASAEPRCAKPCCRAWQTDQVGNGRVPQCNVPRVVPIIVREKAIALASVRLMATPSRRGRPRPELGRPDPDRCSRQRALTETVPRSPLVTPQTSVCCPPL